MFCQTNEYPFIGISQAVRFCRGGNVFVTVDAGLDWFNLDPHPARGPIRVLDPEEMTIAGVKLRSFDVPIPNSQRAEIEKALRKITFHMKYTRPINKEKESGKPSYAIFDAQDECGESHLLYLQPIARSWWKKKSRRLKLRTSSKRVGDATPNSTATRHSSLKIL